MPRNQFDDIGEWASGVAGNYEGELVLSQAEIEDIVDGVIGLMGNLVEDPAEIPSTASVRGRGNFMLPEDLYNYLESGGLVSRDANGVIIAMGIVHILKVKPDGEKAATYRVYIDDET